MRKQHTKLKGAHVLNLGRIVNKKRQIVSHLFDVSTTVQAIKKDSPFKTEPAEFPREIQ